MKEVWFFENDSYWTNKCGKCCRDCNKTYKDCKNHCVNIFIDSFCCGCKYDV